MNIPMVTVVIVNWNGKNLLRDCLESLEAQTYRDFSVVIVDNGSVDGSVGWVKQRFPDVHVIALNKNYGFCLANNIALKEIDSEYVALLNNDAMVLKDWLAHLVAAMAANPAAGFATSKFLYHDHPEKIDRAGDGYTRAGVACLRGRGENARRYDRTEWIFGACAGASIYRTQMLKEIGYFDPDFFLIHEDVDLSFRAQLRGYRCLYVPEAVVLHRASSSIKHDSPVSVYYGHRNLEWVYLKNMPFGLIRKTLIPHIMYVLVSLGFFLIRGQIRPFLMAKRDALKGWRRMIRQRQSIQNEKVVSDRYVWELFEKELFFPRLLHRLNKRRQSY
ncbi:MAG: glycosyltransferase family 2 protein [Desulfosalsimonadaceae bacterium]|nr:glycosyltransferase family 2 protein [Desulfosalsimonadaceae bacterium]